MKEIIDMGTLVCETLKEKDRTVGWLAVKLGADDSNLRKQLNNNEISVDLLLRISVTLKHDFFSIYSESVKKLIEKESGT
jgi:hypothetical protein